MKSKVLITVGAIMIAIAGLLFFFNGNDEKEKGSSDVKVKDVAYEILDDSVELDKAIEEWKKKNVAKEGFYAEKTKEETFVLISAGKKDTTGYGISLNAVKQKGDKVTVEYEVIPPAKDDKVEKKETIPHMVLRVASKDVEVLGKIAPLETQVEAQKEPSKEDSKTKEK